MNNLTMGFENIVAANGITIAVMGMVIVFLSLAVIASAIALLPKILPLLEMVLPTAHHGTESAPSVPADHEKVLAAIGYALFRKEVGSLPAGN